MKTYQEVMQLTLGRTFPLIPRVMSLSNVLGLVLAGDVVSADSVPPFTNSAMDGFAVRVADCKLASTDSPVRLKIIGKIQAGQSEVEDLQVGNSYRIMTGSVIPLGADTVIPVEEVKVLGDEIEISKCPKQGDHVRLAGEDISAGEVTVPRGRILRPAEIGVLATIGCTEVLVYPRPTVTIITTGSELIDAADRPSFGQVRDANIYSMCAQAEAVGAIVKSYPRTSDKLSAVNDVLIKSIAEADVVLVNGGVSVGDFDYTKAALKNLGAEQVFWRVAQKPGGPLGMWVLEGKLVFGIPGNPVAAMIMFEEYVRPVLRKMMGYRYVHRPERIGIMDTDWYKRSSDGRMNFLRVTTRLHNQQIYVAPSGLQGSGILSSMMWADALALIPAEVVMVPAGSEVLLHLIDKPEDH